MVVATQAEGLLDRDQVHPAQVQLRGAEMPQHMRGDPLRNSGDTY